MSEDSTRRLLRAFGIAVTDLEDALEANQVEQARRAAQALRERLKEVVELAERLAERASKL